MREMLFVRDCFHTFIHYLEHKGPHTLHLGWLLIRVVCSSRFLGLNGKEENVSDSVRACVAGSRVCITWRETADSSLVAT